MNHQPKIKIVSSGKYVPPGLITNEDLEVMPKGDKVIGILRKVKLMK